MSSKLREALIGADILLSLATFDEDVEMDAVEKIRSEIKAAITEPVRNCDVGTAEEQNKRFRESCKYLNAPLSQNRTCVGCPVHDEMGKIGKTVSCELVWLQMPYETEEGGAE